MAVIWKDVPGFPNYQVSRTGKVKRLACDYGNYPANKIMTPSANGQVTLKVGHNKYKTVSVAALLLRAFVGPPPSAKQAIARHLDDNKKNNRLKNLAWGSRYDNMQDAIRNGRQGAGSPSRVKAAAALAGRKRPREVFAKMVATRWGKR